MHTLTASDAKRNFGDLLVIAQRAPLKISKNSKDNVVVMSIKYFEELEAMKVEYLEHCFKSAKEDVNKGNAADGDSFLNSL
ncbi:type II toxin-antitoxin system prevent-host-death family antitoxin [Enterovibrio norvegicus]|uniref:type II toxin-antitoxin system prevent-host-death family antitoxin n=1 Tax=Enterovibrio norvegicus TaxID=188144 RepID=UPI0010BF58D7|nr:type II toxin-antitoxin system prevent-host-death family antitoxin [Enterovibrio norvegicus]TKF08133.1 type II toxin-antitoxin system prevent-host-death family antitoxin [Enterovibrio norvegicus]